MVTRKDFTTLADMFGKIVFTMNTNKKVGLDKDMIDSFMKKLNKNYNPEKFWNAVLDASLEQLIEYEQ